MSLPRFPFDQTDSQTTERMAFYYTVNQRCLNALNALYGTTNLEATLGPTWKQELDNWTSNPASPTTFPELPITQHSMHEFFKKCDALCNTEPVTTRQLLHVFFSSCAGSQFMLNSLVESDHPAMARISQDSARQALEAMYMAEEIKAATSGMDLTSTPQIDIDDILSYRDTHRTTRTIRIKDRGSNIAKGEYYIATTLINPDNEDDDVDDSQDEEVPSDIMAEWVQARV